jgi:hypothetical protein
VQVTLQSRRSGLLRSRSANYFDRRLKGTISKKRGWLKVNHLKERGFAILQCDDDRKELFWHISGFRCDAKAIYGVEYRTPLAFQLGTDPRSGRALAVDVEVLDAGGNMIELPARQKVKRDKTLVLKRTTPACCASSNHR